MYIVHPMNDVFGTLANRGKNYSPSHQNKDAKWKNSHWVQRQ